MKKLFVIILFFIRLSIQAQDINALDRENGFRGVHFGDSVRLYPGMKAISFSPDSFYISYRKTDEDFSIGGAKVDIVYTFYKGQLATVYIKADDSLSSQKVLKSLQYSYGKGRQDDPYLQKYNWYGRLVVMAYMEDVNHFDARIYISSIKMKLKMEGRDKY